MKEKMRRQNEGYRDLIFNDRRRSAAVFDLEEMLIPTVLADAFLRAVTAIAGHTKINTQRRYVYSLKYFCEYLRMRGIENVLPFSEDVFNLFRIWMESRTLNYETSRMIAVKVKSILRWCHRNVSGIVAARIDLSLPARRPSSEIKPSVRRRFSKEDTKLVLAHCYRAIEKIEKRMEYGRRLINDENLLQEEKYEGSILRKLLALGNGRIPLSQEIHVVEFSFISKVKAAGGLEHFRDLVTISLSDVLPFYIAVLVQTGGNPVPILAMEMGAVQEHPLRQDLEILVWEKPRSGREQITDFPKDKEWSAPSIVRRILKLNANLRDKAMKGYERKVFLSIGYQQHFANTPSIQTLHNSLDVFLVEHGLPKFDFVDWRHSNADAHFQEFSDIKVSQRRLNHQSVETTHRYINIQKFNSGDDKALREFQGDLIKRRSIRSESMSVVKSDIGADTVFGFRCKDPFAGVDQETPIGKRCLNFSACSTCAGALVVLDDPVVIGRILVAKEALEEAQRRADLEGWTARFKSVYQITLNIIQNELLPSISPALIEKVRKLKMSSHIPRLE